MENPEDDAMALAIHEQVRHVVASRRRDRANWTSADWVDDAERLMSDLHGSTLSLVNGHVLALIREVQELRARVNDVQRGTLIEAKNDLKSYLDSGPDLRNPGIEFAIEWLDDRSREI